MGLQVGDRVEIGKAIYKVDYDVDSKDYYFKSLEIGRDDENLYCVIDLKLEYEILPRPKRVGDMLCKEINCRNCPIRVICLEDKHISNSLYFNLELYNNDQCINFDQEIYDLLKERLNKEVVEE